MLFHVPSCVACFSSRTSTKHVAWLGIIFLAKPCRFVPFQHKRVLTNTVPRYSLESLHWEYNEQPYMGVHTLRSVVVLVEMHGNAIWLFGTWPIQPVQWTPNAAILLSFVELLVGKRYWSIPSSSFQSAGHPTGFSNYNTGSFDEDTVRVGLWK